MTSSNLLSSRDGTLPSTSYSYKTGGIAPYGLDVVFGEDLKFDESRMSMVIPFADGSRRDGVGDLLEVAGIKLDRHRTNAIVLFDHGKKIDLPIAMAWEWDQPSGKYDTSKYTVQIDPVMKTASLNAFFYQGKGGLPTPNAFKSDYDHALLCEQYYDMAVKGLLRGGSIGYQVVKGYQLPPDYETGVPQGVHLLQTLMLEGSLVVLPANQDTVQKMLCKGTCCGKPLSPYLVKSLRPFAPPKRAMMGYEKAFDPNRKLTNQTPVEDLPPPGTRLTRREQQEQARVVRDPAVNLDTPDQPRLNVSREGVPGRVYAVSPGSYSVRGTADQEPPEPYKGDAVADIDSYGDRGNKSGKTLRKRPRKARPPGRTFMPGVASNEEGLRVVDSEHGPGGRAVRRGLTPQQAVDLSRSYNEQGTATNDPNALAEDRRTKAHTPGRSRFGRPGTNRTYTLGGTVPVPVLHENSQPTSREAGEMQEEQSPGRRGYYPEAENGNVNDAGWRYLGDREEHSLKGYKKYITHDGRSWKVHSESGRVLGTHPTKERAERQLRAVEANKHRKAFDPNRRLNNQLPDEDLPPPGTRLTRLARSDADQRARIVREPGPYRFMVSPEGEPDNVYSTVPTIYSVQGTANQGPSSHQIDPSRDPFEEIDSYGDRGNKRIKALRNKWGKAGVSDPNDPNHSWKRVGGEYVTASGRYRVTALSRQGRVIGSVRVGDAPKGTQGRHGQPAPPETTPQPYQDHPHEKNLAKRGKAGFGDPNDPNEAWKREGGQFEVEHPVSGRRRYRVVSVQPEEFGQLIGRTVSDPPGGIITTRSDTGAHPVPPSPREPYKPGPHTKATTSNTNPNRLRYEGGERIRLTGGPRSGTEGYVRLGEGVGPMGLVTEHGEVIDDISREYLNGQTSLERAGSKSIRFRVKAGPNDRNEAWKQVGGEFVVQHPVHGPRRYRVTAIEPGEYGQLTGRAVSEPFGNIVTTRRDSGLHPVPRAPYTGPDPFAEIDSYGDRGGKSIPRRAKSIRFRVKAGPNDPNHAWRKPGGEFVYNGRRYRVRHVNDSGWVTAFEKIGSDPGSEGNYGSSPAPPSPREPYKPGPHAKAQNPVGGNPLNRNNYVPPRWKPGVGAVKSGPGDPNSREDEFEEGKTWDEVELEETEPTRRQTHHRPGVRANDPRAPGREQSSDVGKKSLPEGSFVEVVRGPHKGRRGYLRGYVRSSEGGGSHTRALRGSVDRAGEAGVPVNEGDVRPVSQAHESTHKRMPGRKAFDPNRRLTDQTPPEDLPPPGTRLTPLDPSTTGPDRVVQDPALGTEGPNHGYYLRVSREDHPGFVYPAIPRFYSVRGTADEGPPSHQMDPSRDPFAEIDSYGDQGGKNLDLRRKHRPGTGLRRKVKYSSPGSSIVYVDDKDLEPVRKLSRDKNVTCKILGTHSTGAVKLHLFGHDKDLDEIAQAHGRPLKVFRGRGMKSLLVGEKGGDGLGRFVKGQLRWRREGDDLVDESRRFRLRPITSGHQTQRYELYGNTPHGEVILEDQYGGQRSSSRAAAEYANNPNVTSSRAQKSRFPGDLEFWEEESRESEHRPRRGVKMASQPGDRFRHRSRVDNPSQSSTWEVVEPADEHDSREWVEAELTRNGAPDGRGIFRRDPKTGQARSYHGSRIEDLPNQGQQSFKQSGEKLKSLRGKYARKGVARGTV